MLCVCWCVDRDGALRWRCRVQGYLPLHDHGSDPGRSSTDEAFAALLPNSTYASSDERPYSRLAVLGRADLTTVRYWKSGMFQLPFIVVVQTQWGTISKTRYSNNNPTPTSPHTEQHSLRGLLSCQCDSVALPYMDRFTSLLSRRQ